MSIDALIDRYLAPIPRLRWITLRALICLFAVGYVLARWRVLTDFSRLPVERFAPVGPVTLLDAPVSASTSAAIAIATIVLGVLAALGRWVLFTVPALATCLWWVTSYRNSWGMLFHTENLLVLHTFVLALGTWLVDGTKIERDNHTVSGWPVRLMTSVTLATYMIAGIAKLKHSGAAWADGEILRHHIAFDALRKVQLGSDFATLGARFVQQTAYFTPLAWATLALEIGAPLALVHRYVRWLWIGSAWGFHMGVQLLMWIGFPYPLSVIAYASMLPVERLWRLPGLTQVARVLRLANR